jgi:hypothetical protein
MLKTAWVINDEGVTIGTINYTHYDEGKFSDSVVLFHVDDKIVGVFFKQNIKYI